MTQLYHLKNGSVGNFSEVYKEECIEALSMLPKAKLVSYVKQLIKSPSCFANDPERLKSTLKTLTSEKSSIAKLNQSLELIAEIEYSRVFSSDSEISEAAERDMKLSGRTKY
ncbi:hypothetical protein FJZ53_00335 [Candidatus Woesearchaeota archaeon]|nr:hypothetical protein [Candidatus Woesearchaeota archaeon]